MLGKYDNQECGNYLFNCNNPTFIVGGKCVKILGSEGSPKTLSEKFGKLFEG